MRMPHLSHLSIINLQALYSILQKILIEIPAEIKNGFVKRCHYHCCRFVGLEEEEDADLNCIRAEEAERGVCG